MRLAPHSSNVRQQEPDALMFLLSLPLLIVFAGGIAGFVASSFYLRSMGRKRVSVLVVLVVVTLATTPIPYMGQQFYEAGFSTGASFIIEGVGYFAFAFATVGAWMFLAPSRTRWLLLVLVPVLLAHPLILAITGINWAIYGYHP